jgi:hypothetical protein
MCRAAHHIIISYVNLEFRGDAGGGKGGKLQAGMPKNV